VDISAGVWSTVPEPFFDKFQGVGWPFAPLHHVLRFPPCHMVSTSPPSPIRDQDWTQVNKLSQLEVFLNHVH